MSDWEVRKVSKKKVKEGLARFYKAIAEDENKKRKPKRIPNMVIKAV